ncbi:uncharacterized protein FIBRA_02113 [Fibroporia radiculosa]|uniref:Ras-GAP domain-containing protein n=1 Tax=Fibroporia radiculosa TaxID=599839 RepID=J4I8V8_9APHY|nr:uncharacterized protein FIBRA_02113 [Fibroporia radiculosa]CCM00086.1 predicted protein [Fibroporia radiculosa]
MQPKALRTYLPSDRALWLYSHLLYLLRSRPELAATLCRSVCLSEIDQFLNIIILALHPSVSEGYLAFTFVRLVIQSQVLSTPELTSLFRLPTPFSRLLIVYTRREATLSYLKTALAGSLTRLADHPSLNIEINPMKVYAQLLDTIMATNGSVPPELPQEVTMEEATMNEDVHAIIVPRLAMLTAIASNILESVIDSLESVPYDIRWICGQIKSGLQRQFPAACEEDIHSVVGQFFLQRLIIPAVNTPQEFCLIARIPSPNSWRTFTLVATMLEGLITTSSSASADKLYMKPLIDPFVEANRSRINTFLRKLCQVNDPDKDYLADLPETDRTITLTVNELYYIHSLLNKYIDNFVRLVHLSIALGLFEDLPDLDDNTPAQVPLADNAAVQLRVASRWDVTRTLVSD